MTSDDCLIIALLGRELLGWGTTPPDASQFPIFYRPEGDAYVEQCPWREMGVVAPPPERPATDDMRFFTQPKYRDGGATAEVSFVTRLSRRDRRGRASPPYVNQLDLTVSKVDGAWTITRREQGPMT